MKYIKNNKDIINLMEKLNQDPARKQHMDLLADAFFENLQRDNVEFGGWGLDSKRPFGNSFVEPDIAEICGFSRDIIYDEDENEDEEYCNYFRSLYDDLGLYLQYKWKALNEKQ